MKRKVINKNNKRLQNHFDLGGWEDTAKSVAMSTPYGAMAVGFDSLALGASNKANELFGGEAYNNNPDWINEGIYGDSSGTHIGKMWSKNKTLEKTVDKIKDYGNERFNSTTNEGLLNEFLNTEFLKESNVNGFALDGADIIDNLFDPGSAILRGIVGAITGKKQKSGRERQDEINEAIRDANARKISSFNYAINQNRDRQKFTDMQNLMAFGGPYYIDGAINYDLAQKNLENKRLDTLSKNRITALPASGSTESVNVFGKGGKIHIKPSKRGTFTAAAKKRGMGVQAFASKVLANKENYSPAMVKKANFARNASKWKHAFGGELEGNGTLFDLGYNNIGNGGSHENNIYGGVPVSMDSQGIPNLVEQGEVIWKDKNYVFSDRLINPETGNTFAKDAKKAQQEAKERPNDAISKRGLDKAYSNLANIQEQVRQAEGVDDNKYPDGGDMDVDWSTYNPNGWWDVMRQSSILPGIYGLLNPPKAYSYKVPRAREVTYNPLGDALVYTPLDVDYRINQYRADAAATRRALANMGNPLSQASLLAADYNAQQGLGDLIRKAAEFDLEQRQAIGQFNLARGRYNQEADLQADRYNQATDLEMAKLESDAQRYYQDQLDKVYGSKAGNLSNLFGNLSNIGKDKRNQYDALWSARFLPGGQTIKHS